MLNPCPGRAIIPLAKLLGEGTEELALRVGQTLGGLLNACVTFTTSSSRIHSILKHLPRRTLGNATELIIAILALVKCELDVVQSSLLGSILSCGPISTTIYWILTSLNAGICFSFWEYVACHTYNDGLSLTSSMQMCFFAGGIRFSEQGFSTTAAQLNSSLLMMSVVAILIPAGFVRRVPLSTETVELGGLSRLTFAQHAAFGSLADNVEGPDVLKMSRGIAIILLLVYGWSSLP